MLIESAKIFARTGATSRTIFQPIRMDHFISCFESRVTFVRFSSSHDGLTLRPRGAGWYTVEVSNEHDY